MPIHPVWRTFRRPWREFARTVLDLLVPPVCPSCGGHVDGEGLCRACAQNLVQRPQAGCARCGEPALAADRRCGSDHRELTGLAYLVAPFRYAGTGGDLVRRFKLDANAGAGRWLARAMAVAWRAQVGGAFGRACAVSVPLHWRRRRERGFDQAAWLAQALAVRLGWRVIPGALRRVRATLPQGDPRVTSREGNVEGAFAVARRGGWAGRHVVLIDDVFTSGATLRQCARLLREAGAVEVAALVACRS